MSVSLKIAKKRRIEPPTAAFADPDDDTEPELTPEERDKQVQKLKVLIYIADIYQQLSSRWRD
jgi:hypothetical protein